MTEIEAMPEGWEIVGLGAQSVAIQTEKILPHIYQTRMTRIGRISTDNFDPCASVSSVQSVFYRNPSMIDDDKKPQMNADERRYLLVTYFIKTTHRKGRKERKAMQHESLRPLRSLRLNISSAPAPERAPPSPAVHMRTSRAGE